MKNALSLISTITRVDSYKFSQFAQYPKGTTHISSYIESRGGEDESVFFGLQAFIKDYLLTPVTMKDVDRAEKIVTAHGVGVSLFDLRGDDARQDAVAVGALGSGVTSMVMHRVGDDVLSEVARELDQVSDTVGCFEEDCLWYSIFRLDVL